jgi:exopolyphosphatase/guanosine-5'-triphosphate,3'-diphosphate pyrophosphatase
MTDSAKVAPLDKTAASRPRQRARPGRGPRHGGGRPAPALAALDLGTNNCRLLVARPKGPDFEVIDAFSRPVRLGEGVESSNRLTEEAQARAIKALRICASKIRHHRARAHRIVATEACRRAENGAAFIERAERATGLRLRIIEAGEEARLAVAGCAPLIDPEAEQLLVFDIGGGSTELIWIDLSRTEPEGRRGLVRRLSPTFGEARGDDPAAHAITDWISVPMGVSTLNERFGHIADEPARFAEMTALFDSALARFAPYREAERRRQTEKLQIVGVSGTATTFGAVHLGLRGYDRSRVDGLWLPSAAAQAIAEELLALGLEGRVRHPGIGRGRASLVLSGAAILATILRIWPVERMRIADRGLREGMLYGLIERHRADGR